MSIRELKQIIRDDILDIHKENKEMGLKFTIEQVLNTRIDKFVMDIIGENGIDKTRELKTRNKKRRRC